MTSCDHSGSKVTTWFGSLRRPKKSQSTLSMNLCVEADQLKNSRSTPHLASIGLQCANHRQSVLLSMAQASLTLGPVPGPKKSKFSLRFARTQRKAKNRFANFDETPELADQNPSDSPTTPESSHRNSRIGSVITKITRKLSASSLAGSFELPNDSPASPEPTLEIGSDFEVPDRKPVMSSAWARRTRRSGLEAMTHSQTTLDRKSKGSQEPRARSLTTVTLDRRVFAKKRSTVWYNTSHLDLACHQLKDEIAHVTEEMDSMDNGEESKNAARAKQLSLGRKKFNMDPKKGIEFLVQQGLLQNTPQDISAFLYRGEGLSKTAIGDYLGEKSPFHEQVLKAFVDLHDFTDLILVQALRQFLWSFRLPGEAQKIDRMMESFAQRYCHLNPNIFSNSDTCYVLSFAVIMLNTSLHNPSVKDKPSVEQFIAMNRGINDGKDLPRDILESLYESIKAEPFKIPEDDGNDLMHTFFNPDREGWLWKQGGRYKSWKRRWFILNDNCLYYFEYTTDKEPRGIIPLENIQVREVIDRNKPNCFELYAAGSNEIIKACKTDSEGKVVEGKHTVYRMSAATPEEKESWIACIRQSISHNPFYDMLAARKKKAQKSGSRTKT